MQPTPPPGPSGSSLDSETRKKGKRQSKPKVKTGCLNCKQRRIKCDEARPTCHNCVKSKRECNGYPPPPRTNGYPQLRIAPKPLSQELVPFQTQDPRPLVLRRDEKLKKRSQIPTVSVVHVPIPQFPLPPIPSGQMQLQLAPVLREPSILQLDGLEFMYFQLFQSSTASELSGYFDSGFWTKSVLQGAEVEPAIRHAVIALGALYKTLEKSSESPPTSPDSVASAFDTPQHHWNTALRHYQRALGEMVAVKEMEMQSMRTQLMANVLLACFDSFVGHHREAISQIQTGLVLLEQLRQMHKNNSIVGSQEPDEDLKRMFNRLAIQAKTYDMAFHFPEPHVVRLVSQNSSNEAPMSPFSESLTPPSSHAYTGQLQFATLFEARIAWDKLVHKIFCFTERMFQSNNGPMGLLPGDIRRYGEKFHQQLKEWEYAFNPLVQSRHDGSVPSQVKAGIATLRMTYVMSYILFVMTSDHNEMGFDAYKDSFQEIISLALEVVADQERRAAMNRGCHSDHCPHKHWKMDIFGNSSSNIVTYHIKPSFSADMGIVQPLYVVATKCRDPIIRRQAIQLLRNSARREAMWDSELCARIGKWILDIEEDNLDMISPLCQQFPTQIEIGQRLSVASSTSPQLDLGDALGPGGNGSWNYNLPRRTSMMAMPTSFVKEEKRVMVTGVDMDLKARHATLRCGTRGIKKGSIDRRYRETQIYW